MRRSLRGVAALVLLAVLVASCTQQPATPSGSPAASVTPVRAARGGTLTLVTSGQPATYDAHRETSPAVLDVLAPEYSLLYRVDPLDSARTVPDLASGDPQLSTDKLTVTVKLRSDVKFHDGAALTSADVVASYQTILAGSPRASWYAMVDSVSAPDPTTVAFKLKSVTPGFSLLLASPWNVIYSAEKLKQDPRWYETNVDGTGPFVFVSNNKGADWTAKRNASYFGKDAQGAQLPYLDGFTALIRPDAAAQVDAVKTKKATIDFRGFTIAQRDDLAKSIGGDLALQEVTTNCVDVLMPNTTVKPFDNANVRQAVTLAVDRRGNNVTLAGQTNLRELGGLVRPHSVFAIADADLQNVKGFGADISAARDQAKKLLSGAGVTSLSFTLLTPEGDSPYGPETSFLIDQWKQAGIAVTRDAQANSAALIAQGAYQVALVTRCFALDEPDLVLAGFRGAFGDSKVNDLFDAETHESDLNKRTGAVVALQKYLMDEKAYALPVLWWYRSVPYLKALRGWQISPGDGNGEDLATAWLAPQ